MRNIVEICKAMGIDVPEDKSAALLKAVNDEGYVTRAEMDGKISRITAERDTAQQRAQTAEDALKKFDGIDPQQIQAELDSWKQKAETAQRDAEQKLAQRDFADALQTAMAEIKFTSTAAKRAVMAEVSGTGLTVKDGKILGLNDLLDTIREKDPSAFVDEEQEEADKHKAKFTTSKHKETGKLRDMSLDEIMALKRDHPEQYAALKRKE